MPRIKETTVYKYSELSDRAKERARDWYREASAGDNFFAEFVTDDFHTAAKALGFDVYQRRGRYLDPRDPRALRSTLEWSGFWSQGDGAAFGGTWYASDMVPQSVSALLADRPVSYEVDGKPHENASNKELHRIAGELVACKNAGLEHAVIEKGRGNFMRLDSAEHAQPEGTEEGDARDAYVAQCEDNENRFIEAARDLANWFYRALEEEYTYQNSDDVIAENIRANEYEFTEEGKPA